MPEIINHFKKFITALEEFNFLPLPKEGLNSILINEQKQDQETLTNLLTLLKLKVKDKVDDLDISHNDLTAVKNTCKPCFNIHLQQLVSENIKEFCKNSLLERSALFSNVYGFIFNCKIVTDMSLIDFSKVEHQIVAVCKILFKTDNLKSYIESTDIGILLGLLNNEFLFSRNLMFSHLTNLQKGYEEKLVAISKAREGLSPTRFEGGDFTTTPFFKDKFANLRKYGRDPFSTSSAPNSPTGKQVPSPKGPSSLPSSPHKPLDNLISGSNDEDEKVKDSSRTRSSSHNVPPLRFLNASAQKPVPKMTGSDDPLSGALSKLKLAPSNGEDLEGEDLGDKLGEDVIPKSLHAPRDKRP